MRTLSPEPRHTPSVPADEPAGFWNGWDRFWFKPADPTTLGFIRVCTGIVVVYVHLCYTFGLLDYVGPEAWLDTKAAHWLRHEVPIVMPGTGWFEPARQHGKGHFIWSIYFHLDDPSWIYATHFAILGAMVLFTAGLWTRVTSVLTCVGSLCYLHRAPTTLFGMDTMMNLLLIYLMIGPSGAALSVDHWLQRRRERANGRDDAPPEPLSSANFALRLLQVNFCMIYLASGLSKLLGAAWWNGTALWYTMANYSLNLSWYYGFLVWLSKHRIAWELVMTSGVVFTLVMEIGLPFLIWRPRLRWWLIAGSALLHLGIGVSMGLVTFSLFMLCLLFSFVPAQAVHQLLARLKGQGDSLDPPWERGGERQRAGRELEPADYR